MTRQQHAVDLTAEEVLDKRRQLLDDGFCVIPGVLRGDLLDRTRRFSDEFLDTHDVDHHYRYQGSDFHIMAEESWAKDQDASRYHAPIVDELLNLPAAVGACDRLGLESMTSAGSIILLSKPPHGPPLYWHQDATYWNHPKSALPWPSRVFLSYYLVDTTRQNGCLRIIPGTHRKRTELHDQLPDAHSPEMQRADETHLAFTEQPGEIDIPVKAGDLVIADGRVLHAAWPNNDRHPAHPGPRVVGPVPVPVSADLVGRRGAGGGQRRSPTPPTNAPASPPTTSAKVGNMPSP